MFLKVAIASLSLSLIASVAGLNIVLTNDDSWASANIRATHKALKDDGHDVLLVGPAVQQSGKGGAFVLPTSNITAPGAEFGSVPAGAPYYGHDLQDQSIWYVNATPAATAIFALDILVPKHFGDKAIDLILSGPNEGWNAGSSFFTLSGTIGASYAGIERGYPAVAMSAGNNTHRSYTTNNGDASDPAEIVARLTVNFVRALIKGCEKGKPLLPSGTGISINYPIFGPGNPCTEPPFTLTRMTGGGTINQVSIDATGFPVSVGIVTDAVNTGYNGDKSLPGDTVIAATCATAVSIFTIDYDAPEYVAKPIRDQLKYIVGKSEL